MPRAAVTLPFDLVLALRLVTPAGTFAQIAEELAVAPSQVHAALRRLSLAGLIRPGKRATNTRALAEFLGSGIRYSFPARREALTSGVPTAYSASPLSADIDATDVLVWSAPQHPSAVQGFGIAPLYRAAPQLLTRSPATYQLLTMVDALRLGDPRIRLPARERLEAALGIR